MIVLRHDIFSDTGGLPAAWAKACAELDHLQPWTRVPEVASFRFAGIRELQGRVAGLVGHGGGSCGVLLFDAEEVPLVLSRLASGAEDGPRGVIGLSLVAGHLVAPDALAARRAAGLVLASGRVIAVSSGSTGRAVTAADLQALLAAVEAIVQLCRQKLPRIAKEDQRARVTTSLGAGIVSSRPVPEPPPLVAGLVSLVSGSWTPPGGVLLPVIAVLGAEDAVKAAASRVERVDLIRLVRAPEGRTWVLAEAAGDLLGALSPEALFDDTIAAIEARGAAVLALAVRPPKGRAPRRRDVLVWRPVGVRRADGTCSPRPEGLPSASEEELSRIVQTAGAGRISQDFLRMVQTVVPSDALANPRVQSLMDHARVVWNAVLLADDRGDPGLLDELLQLSAVDPTLGELTQALIMSKRALFPHDLRYIQEVTAVHRPGGRLDVSVAAEQLSPRA